MLDCSLYEYDANVRRWYSSQIDILWYTNAEAELAGEYVLSRILLEQDPADNVIVRADSRRRVETRIASLL